MMKKYQLLKLQLNKIVIVIIVLFNCLMTQANNSYAAGFEETGLPEKDIVKLNKIKKYALLVGIGKYDDKFTELLFADNDARELADVLSDKNLGNFDDVTVLNTPEKTTRNFIMAELKKLKNKITDPNSIILIYISSHGEISPDENGTNNQYVVTTDTLKNNVAASGINMKEIKYIFKNINSKRKVLILDSCHSEISDKIKRIKGSMFDFDDLMVSSIILSSASWDQNAIEEESLQHSVFTYYLIEALRERKDMNNDGAINVSEAYNYASLNTRLHTHFTQQPRVNSGTDLMGIDNIYLVGEKKSIASNSTIYDFSGKYSGEKLEINGKYIADLDGMFVLNTSGKHNVKIVQKGSGKTLEEKEIYIRAGENYILSEEFEKNYNFLSFVDLSSGLYVPSETAFKSTYQVNVEMNDYTYYSTDTIQILLNTGIMITPEIKATETTNAFPDGAITTNLKMSHYSLNNSIYLSLQPPVGTFEIGSTISINYTTSTRKLSGTGAYNEISSRSTTGSDIYFGLGISGKYMYDITQNLSLFGNIGYIINKPTFKIKKGAVPENFREIDAKYDLSAMNYSLGIRYNF